MASGSGAQIAIFAVGSLYSTIGSAEVAAANWTNFVSESLEHTLQELEEGAITGYKDAPPSHKGLDFGEGDIQLEPNPNALGHFMRAVFGQSSGSILTDAGSWGANSGSALQNPAGYSGARAVVQHRFVPIQSAYEERCYLPPYGIMVHRDVGSAFIFGPGCISGLEFQLQAGQLVKAAVSGVMARNVDMLTRPSSAAALRNPGGRPWVWDMASIQVGPGVSSLAAHTFFESLNIRLEVPMEGVVLLDGTKKYAEYQVNGFRRVAISGSMSFRNLDEYNAFKNYENRYLRATMANVNSDALLLGNPDSPFWYTLQLNIPQFKLLSFSPPIQGPNRVVANFTGKAEFDTTSLYMIEALLTNITSAYASP